ncbi:MAG: hypothetical protein ACE5IM_08645 [Nitrospinota bacterium]
MNERPSAASTLSERLTDIPLIEAALARAVQDALRLHKLAGNPIAEWRDGKVVWVPPEDIPVEQEGAARA